MGINERAGEVVYQSAFLLLTFEPGERVVPLIRHLAKPPTVKPSKNPAAFPHN
jgi:hypothetical protein